MRTVFDSKLSDTFDQHFVAHNKLAEDTHTDMLCRKCLKRCTDSVRLCDMAL